MNVKHSAARRENCQCGCDFFAPRCARMSATIGEANKIGRLCNNTRKRIALWRAELRADNRSLDVLNREINQLIIVPVERLIVVRAKCQDAVPGDGIEQ